MPTAGSFARLNTTTLFLINTNCFIISVDLCKSPVKRSVGDPHISPFLKQYSLLNNKYVDEMITFK